MNISDSKSQRGIIVKKKETNIERERENKETEIFVTNTARPKYY